MSDSDQPTTPPGWYPDGQGSQRWYDGTQWTEHTMPAEPGAAPEPAPQATEPPPTPTPTPPSSPQTSSFDAPTVFPGAPTPQATPQAAPPAAPPWQQPPGAPQQAAYGAPQAAWQGQLPANDRGGRGKLIGLIGGGAVLLVILLILLFTVVLGGGAGPSSVAEDYFAGVTSGDCDVIDLLSKDFREGFDVSKKECEDAGGDEYLDAGASGGCDFEVTNEKVDGDKATVKYEVSGCDESDNDETGTISLVKEGSDWKVSDFV